MNTEQQWKAVRAHIAKGDKAKDKAEQHYITAGQYLKSLKAKHTGTRAEWEVLVKENVVRQLRDRQSFSPLRSGEPEASDERTKLEIMREQHRIGRATEQLWKAIHDLEKSIADLEKNITEWRTGNPEQFEARECFADALHKMSRHLEDIMGVVCVGWWDKLDAKPHKPSLTVVHGNGPEAA